MEQSDNSSPLLLPLPGEAFTALGLRHIAPYPAEFNTQVTLAKARWVGRTVVDVFTSEFPRHSAEYGKYNNDDPRTQLEVEEAEKDNGNVNNTIKELHSERGFAPGRLRLFRPPPKKGAPTGMKRKKTKATAGNNGPNPAKESSATTPAPTTVPTHGVMPPGTLIQINDVIQYVSHRHELPVYMPRRRHRVHQRHHESSALPSGTSSSQSAGESLVEVIYDQKDLLVISKPATVPVHPCSRYNKNTILEALKLEHEEKLHQCLDCEGEPQQPKEETGKVAGGIQTANEERSTRAPARPSTSSPTSSFFPIHRLDKGTSGVLILARSPVMAKTMGRLLLERKNDPGTSKSYVAKVFGQFPANRPIWVDTPIACHDRATGTSDCRPRTGAEEEEQDAENTAHAAATGTTSQKKEFAAQNLQSALSVFRLLHYDPLLNESLIQAEIFTGRTHQIRVHLQSIGFWIKGDSKYFPPRPTPAETRSTVAVASFQKTARDLEIGQEEGRSEKGAKKQKQEEGDGVDLFCRVEQRYFRADCPDCVLQREKVFFGRGIGEGEPLLAKTSADVLGGATGAKKQRPINEDHLYVVQMCLHAARYIIPNPFFQDRSTLPLSDTSTPEAAVAGGDSASVVAEKQFLTFEAPLPAWAASISTLLEPPAESSHVPK